VTGGTGSFGNALVDYLQKNNPPKKLIVFSRDELKQFDMARKFNQENMRYFLGDIRDRDRLYRACQGVDILIHAAALKQVPAAEYNPFEAVKTNILGAQNIIDACIDQKVSKVIALSTDKAVNPANLYGATKLCSDKIFVAGNAYAANQTRFSIVRYGNVIGSRGSVVPLFLEKRKGGVLPVTDERMTRFWITLEQGVEFVLLCEGKMKGGEIFVPKIPSMRITDLAKAIAPECRVESVGIRPGEKLHETLISEDDARDTVDMGDYFVVVPNTIWWPPERSPQGKSLPEGFVYRSDVNDDMISIDGLKKILGI
jgi:UDP-N-acetylglucosamine 4,6-dehydratase/5-epimerase